MKKVLIIGLGTNYGGVESYVLNLVTQLSKNGEYRLYFPSQNKPLAYQDKIVAMGGIIVDGLSFDRKDYSNYKKSWIDFFKKEKFDVIYYNTCDLMGIDKLIFAKKCGIKKRIVHIHAEKNFRKISFVHKVFQVINKIRIGRVANVLLACSQNAGHWAFGFNKFSVINNTVDTKKYAFQKPVREKVRAQFEIGTTMGLFVGRLSKEKNPVRCFEIIKEYLKYDKKAKFFFCGDGGFKQTLENLIKESGLEKSVVLLGVVNNLVELYMGADYLLMPSITEAFPFTLLEAQATGLNCICSTGVPEKTNIIGNVQYISLEKDNNEWAKKIAELKEDYDRANCADIIDKKGYGSDGIMRSLKPYIS